MAFISQGIFLKRLFDLPGFLIYDIVLYVLIKVVLHETICMIRFV